MEMKNEKDVIDEIKKIKDLYAKVDMFQSEFQEILDINWRSCEIENFHAIKRIIHSHLDSKRLSLATLRGE